MIGIKMNGVYMMDKEKIISMLSIALDNVVNGEHLPKYMSKDEEAVMNVMVRFMRKAYNDGRGDVAFIVRAVIKDM